MPAAVGTNAAVEAAAVVTRVPAGSLRFNCEPTSIMDACEKQPLTDSGQGQAPSPMPSADENDEASLSSPPPESPLSLTRLQLVPHRVPRAADQQSLSWSAEKGLQGTLRINVDKRGTGRAIPPTAREVSATLATIGGLIDSLATSDPALATSLRLGFEQALVGVDDDGAAEGAAPQRPKTTSGLCGSPTSCSSKAAETKEKLAIAAAKAADAAADLADQAKETIKEVQVAAKEFMANDLPRKFVGSMGTVHPAELHQESIYFGALKWDLQVDLESTGGCTPKADAADFMCVPCAAPAGGVADGGTAGDGTVGAATTADALEVSPPTQSTWRYGSPRKSVEKQRGQAAISRSRKEQVDSWFSLRRCCINGCPDRNFAADFWARGRWTPQLLEFQDLPQWRVRSANPHIVRGYRPATGSYKECFRSWFYLHNEWFNIHSHFWPAMLVPVVCILTLQNAYDRGSPALDVMMCLPFYIGAFSCLLFSTLFHTMTDCCGAADKFWTKCDYLGITILTYTSMFPTFHFMFYCEPQKRNLFLGLITGFSVMTGAVVMLEFFAETKWQSLRVGLFVVLGLFSVAPVTIFIVDQTAWYIHLDDLQDMASAIHNGFDTAEFGALGARTDIAGQPVEPGMLPIADEVFWNYCGYMALMAFSYLFGALLYGLNCPERFVHGRFDFFGHSHGIFHVFVVGGVIFTHLAFMQLLDAVEMGGSGDKFCATRGDMAKLVLAGVGSAVNASSVNVSNFSL